MAESKKIKCENCSEEFEITLKDVKCAEAHDRLQVRCPNCGINTGVSWMVFTALGGDCTLF